MIIEFEKWNTSNIYKAIKDAVTRGKTLAVGDLMNEYKNKNPEVMNVVDSNGMNVLHYAAANRASVVLLKLVQKEGSGDAVHELLNAVDMNTCDTVRGQNFMHIVALNVPNMLLTFLKATKDGDICPELWVQRDIYGMTPIDYAVMRHRVTRNGRKSLESIFQELDGEAFVAQNSFAFRGIYTGLQSMTHMWKFDDIISAVRSDNPNGAPVALSKDVFDRCVKIDGMTPLMAAVGRCDLNVVRALIHGGVDINETDELGNTALHYAAVMGYYDIVRELVYNKDCDWNKRNKNNMRPIDCIPTVYLFAYVAKPCETDERVDYVGCEHTLLLRQSAHDDDIPVSRGGYIHVKDGFKDGKKNLVVMERIGRYAIGYLEDDDDELYLWYVLKRKDVVDENGNVYCDRYNFCMSINRHAVPDYVLRDVAKDKAKNEERG